MTLPKPEAGLVIRYSYLWLREHREGREEGVKDRPCAIVLAAKEVESGDTRVLVVPITHNVPEDLSSALELPRDVKRLIGLDSERSWVVLSESNLFAWPGPDLRRIDARDQDSFAYGFLPPKIFAQLKRRFLALGGGTTARRVPRTE